ncbi:MAG: GTP 3',8-cyclase MoaA [Nitrospiraceae bacterium]
MSADSVDSRTSMVVDAFSRPLRSLRISVTDRCNLRCKYCMPEEEYAWLPRETLLSFEEINTITDLFTELGVDKVRLTGGEPLLRRDLPALVRMLAKNRRLKDVALTTNGILLAEQAQALYDAGLHRVTVSLDTLRPERFRALTRRDSFDRVLDGIAAVAKIGFPSLKLDTVAIRGFNDDELIDLIEYGKRMSAEVRFIEYMDVGGATDWSMGKVLSRSAILEMVGARYGTVDPLREEHSAPAQRFRLPDGVTFGIIPSTTTPFCSTCDRSRLTADGLWYLCLYAKDGVDLRQPLRAGASREDIKAIIRSGWQGRRDRGAEDRKALERLGLREARLIDIDKLREDPHLEMHARGG